MSDSPTSLIVAEPKATYESGGDPNRWVEALVDCPGLEGLLTYRIPEDLSVKPGDILTVPLNNRQVGAIAIRLLASPPADVSLAKIREVEDVVCTGFFENSYWRVLERVAQYYCTPLISVVRGALPPGLLMRSQRRVRLHREAVPDGADTFVGRTARQILALLDAQPEGDYSVAYLQRQVKGARRGVKDLLKRGWVESYLKPPQPSRPKQKKAVTLVADRFDADVTERQREVLDVLRRRGGDLWLNELLQVCHATSSIVNKLAEKGYVVVEYREILRTLDQPNVADDCSKVLTEKQTHALQTIQSLDGFSQVLLHGVTGSGKTEVYLQAIAPLLRAGQSALVLVPEIGLTPQLTDRFRARFGKKVNVYHSGLSHGERYDTWRQVLSGDPQVVIGTRSAIFVPLPKLGLIILDEEHDSSFKQDSLPPTYHARTVAQWRAELENCPLVLGSATPSLETWVSVNGQPANRNTDAPCKTYYLSLPERIQSRPLPPVEIVDMRQEFKQGNRSIFSRSLQDGLQQLQQKQRQGILFIPRRGHSTFVSCRSCGYVIECPDCDVSLSYHYAHEGAHQLLRCHYCNYTTAHPNNCPECGSPYLKFFGSGTQRVTQELAKAFPDLRVIRFDSDTTRTKGAHRTLLTQFANGEADLLIGTQMLTKGLDLAGVTLVGVVAADGLLHLSDYRAAERAFQTLTQVAGRAGRGDEPGQVIVQTYSPQHPVIQAVKTHGYEVFTEAELAQRESLNYPPYGHLILLRLSGLEEMEVEKAAEMLADWLSQAGSAYEILGPAPAGIMRIARRYRWQILLKFPPDVAVGLPDVAALQRICPPDVSLTIDVDPLNMF